MQERLLVGAGADEHSDPILFRSMRGEGLLVGFTCLFFALVERSNETLGKGHDVRGPLPYLWGEECVRRFSTFSALGNWQRFLRRGRTIRARDSQHWEFDSTRGYPGEDISFTLQAERQDN